MGEYPADVVEDVAVVGVLKDAPMLGVQDVPEVEGVALPDFGHVGVQAFLEGAVA